MYTCAGLKVSQHRAGCPACGHEKKTCMRFNIFESIDFPYQSYKRNTAITNVTSLSEAEQGESWQHSVNKIHTSR